MQKTYIFQHLGMGDFLICNSIVRKFINQSQQKEYVLLIPPEYEESVSHMYSDIKNLSFLKIDNGGDAWYGTLNFVNKLLESTGSPCYIIGWRYPQWIIDSNKSFERNFYLSNNIPFEEKWSGFRCPRNDRAEENLYNHFNIKEDYIFVHDDERFRIDQNRLPKNIRTISVDPKLTNCIFDYCKLIENAKEVHCIESSFCFMVDIMNLNQNLYVHRYARSHKIPIFDIPDYYKNAKGILI